MSSLANTSINKYKLSRKGRKLLVSDDHRTLNALSKDVSERTWIEIFQKEENDLVVFEIREEIVDAAMKYCYGKYMEKQNAIFTAHCAAQAWLKLINWHFFRHDPGEEPSAYPLCYIPKRRESWIPDEMPDPSPKDTWSQHDLLVMEELQEDSFRKAASSTSLDYPVVEEIPQEYWFPGKVQLTLDYDREASYLSMQESSGSALTQSDEKFGIESEVLQKVTDYSTDDLSKVSSLSGLKNTTPVDGSLHGAGDSTMMRMSKRKSRSSSFSRLQRVSISGKLPPLEQIDSKSKISMISDCRLRNFRLDTQFEITSEIMETPSTDAIKRKK